MVRPITLAILAFPALGLAQESIQPAPERKKLPAIGLLPDGSQLKGVMLPRYDKDRHLTGVLKSSAMTLVNEEQISGDNISIEFFNPDQSTRGRIDLKTALFNQLKSSLSASESVDIKFGRLSANGTGLLYSFETGRGYLHGPGTTLISTLPKTAMSAPRSSLHTAALIGMSLVTAAEVNARPPEITAEEKAAVHADAAPAAPAATSAQTSAASELAVSVKAADAASQDAKVFLAQASIPVPSTATTPPAIPAPLDVKPSPDETLINYDGGMYFDADAGILVYLKNVRVTDPRFDLKGANELKVFFGKKPAKEPAKDAAPKTPGGFGKIGANLGDVERIVATGAVLITQKNPKPGEQPIQASGAIFSYNMKSGEIILSGGYPWVKRGALFQRAMEPNLNLRIDKNANVVTEGRWQMGGTLNQKK